MRILHGTDSLHSPTASTAWTLFWGLNRRPTTVGGDSADTFPAGAETAACRVGGGYGPGVPGRFVFSKGRTEASTRMEPF